MSSITETKIEAARIRALSRSAHFDTPQEAEQVFSHEAKELSDYINKMNELCEPMKSEVKGLVGLIIGEVLPTDDADHRNLHQRLQHGQLLVGANGTRLGLIAKTDDNEFKSFTNFGNDDYGGVCKGEYERAATEEEINEYFDIIKRINSLNDDLFDCDYNMCFRNKKP